MTMSIHNHAIIILCLIGLGLSIYAYIVDLSLEANSKYVATCDISEAISCSKPFRSEYGRGFGVFPKGSLLYKPNSLFGVLFYSLTATLALSNSTVLTKLSYWAIFVSNFMSLYFAYILYFKLHTLCLVCVSTWTVNALLLVFANIKLRSLISRDEVDSKKKSK